MTIGSFLLVAVTVMLGVVVLAFWSSPERSPDRRSMRLASAHVVTAAAGVSAWMWYLIGRGSAAGGMAVVALVAAAALGGSTLVSSRRRERSVRHEGAPDPVPAALLMAHGAAAAGAIMLAVLAIAQR